MTAQARQIREAIQRIAGVPDNILVILDCTVESVNMDTRTCDVRIIDGDTDTLIEGVLLSAMPNDGLICKPSIGSVVRVAFNDKKPRFVVQFSDIDELHVTIANMEFVINAQGIFQGDESFGGVVKADSVASGVNGQFSSVIAAIQAGFSALSGIDSGVSLTAFNSGIAAYQPLQSANLQNMKFKHGN
jgi:hypothetical protein